MTQLSWTHFIYIIALDDPLQRDFYAEMELPPRKLLEQKLHEAVRAARNRLEGRGEGTIRATI